MIIGNFAYAGLLLSLSAFFSLFVSRSQLTIRQAKLGLVWSTFVFFLLSVYILAFFLLFPEWSVRADSLRYLHEIKMISAGPSDWNPWEGTGPDYNESAKMGYSYFIGSLMWLSGSTILFSALFLNLVMATLTAFLVFVFAVRVTDNEIVATLALIGSAFYPEILFWTGRILRETMVLFLSLIIFLAVVNLFDRPSKKGFFIWGGGLLLATLGLSIVRAQLVLLLPLAVGSWLLAYTATGRIKKITLALSFFLMTMVFLFLWPVFEQQIVRALTDKFLRQFLDLNFWLGNASEALNNVPRILTLVAREEYGVFGYLLSPFVISFSLLLAIGWIGVLFNYRSDFFRHALAIILVSIFFVMALAFYERVNIRFRSVIMPLLCIMAAYGFWWIASSLRFSGSVSSLIRFEWLSKQLASASGSMA